MDTDDRIQKVMAKHFGFHWSGKSADDVPYSSDSVRFNALRQLVNDELHEYAIQVSACLSHEFGEHFPEDKPKVAVLIERTERLLRKFD